MKRALAERAKQSLPGRAPTSSSCPDSQPPLKIARPNPSIVVSAGGPPASNSTPRSPKPTKPTLSSTATGKRPREANGSSRSPQATEEVDETSAFYLKHQNRSLAIELKGWQAQCRDLMAERDQRRSSCWRGVQALQSLQATWTSLETALGQSHPGAPVNRSLQKTEDSAPPSTALVMGRGIDEDKVEMEDPVLAIEWTGALHDALHNLAFPTESSKTKAETAASSGDVGEDPHDVGELAANVSSRASCLQDWLWKVLQAKRVSSEHLERLETPGEGAASENERWKHQVAEVTRSRDYWRAQERRLRRNLYRLEAGIMTLPQVMQVLERQDDLDDIDKEDAEMRSAVQLEKSEQTAATAAKEGAAEVGKVSSAIVDKLNDQILLFGQEKTRREETIAKLNQQIKEQGERINQLSTKQQSAADSKRLETLEATASQLKAAEEQITLLQSQLERTRERWSQAQGNEAAAKVALEDLREKHEKRWSELRGPDEGIATEVAGEDHTVVELRHKLKQGLEHVRQAEDVRANLTDALDMNDKLVARLEEAKAAVVIAEKAAISRSKASDESSHNTSSEKIPTDKTDKLYRDNRRMKEKIVLLTASKENHKSRVERVEKERDSLMDTNARILRQMSDKEEVNARSLSTILHLKSMTDQLTEQRDNLEQQASSANQLALAARLASNAKDRVSYELSKEKEDIEKRLVIIEKERSDVKKELEDLRMANSGTTSKHASISLELTNALKRCDELVAETEAKREEIRRLVDSVDKAEREARESKQTVVQLSKSDGQGTSNFSVDQLNTQVSVLKSRLACPVCHYRDKACIIIKCGHLHCKQCVDERISNRSRKCPTCNQMFSRTDVTDVFLE